MSRRLPPSIALPLSAVAVALSLAACGGGPSTSVPAAPPMSSTSDAPAPSSRPVPSSGAEGSTPTAASSATPVVISIKDFMFVVPASVKAGSVIMLRNDDTANHTVTSTSGGFDVKVEGGGGTAMLTAPGVGSYELTCDYHANMKARLVVR